MSYMTPVADRLAAIEALKPHTPLKVTIIGAGMAGLAAAYEMQRLGCSVHVLEAHVETVDPPEPARILSPRIGNS